MAGLRALMSLEPRSRRRAAVSADPISQAAPVETVPAVVPEADAGIVQKKKKASLGRRVGRELLSWLWIALAFMLITGTLVQARVIPSGSMENTLLVGDHLLMSRVGYDAGLPFTRFHMRL